MKFITYTEASHQGAIFRFVFCFHWLCESRDCWLTSWPVSSTHSLAHCFLASISTLNMVQTDSGTRRSVDLLAFCILASNADFVLWDKDDR